MAVAIVDNDFTLKVLPGFEPGLFFRNFLDFGGLECFHLEIQVLRRLWKTNKVDASDRVFFLNQTKARNSRILPMVLVWLNMYTVRLGREL